MSKYKTTVDIFATPCLSTSWCWSCHDDDDIMTMVVTKISWWQWWWWWWWNNKHTWYLLCARHCSKYFIDMNSFNPYNNSVRWVLLSLFTDKETESQRQQGTHSRARTHSGSEIDRIWKWKDLNPGGLASESCDTDFPVLAQPQPPNQCHYVSRFISKRGMNEPQAHLSTSSWGIFVSMEPASPFVRTSSMYFGAKWILTDHHSGYYLLL